MTDDTQKQAQETTPLLEHELGESTPGESEHQAPWQTAPQGTQADLRGAAESIAFSPSALVVSIVGQIIAGPQQIAVTGRPLTPQERFQDFARSLLGDGKTPGLLAAVDFDGNVVALLERGGVGANLSPGIAVGIGVAAIVGLAFLNRAPKAQRSAPPAAPAQPAPAAAAAGVVKT